MVYKHASDLGLLGREMETFEQLLQPRVEFVVAVVGVNHGRCQQHFCLGQTFTLYRHLDSRFVCETELSCSIAVHSRDSHDKSGAKLVLQLKGKLSCCTKKNNATRDMSMTHE